MLYVFGAFTVFASCYLFFFFFNDTATTEIYTLSLHDALPIFHRQHRNCGPNGPHHPARPARSEEHTSELQSHHDLVCRLLLEKKKKKQNPYKSKNKKKTHKKKTNKTKNQ